MLADRDPETADEIVTRREPLPSRPAARPMPRPAARPVADLPGPARSRSGSSAGPGRLRGHRRRPRRHRPTALRRLGAVAALQPGLLAWYSVRALGFLAYGVLAASVLYGLLLSTKILDTIAHRPVSFALHKDLAIVALLLRPPARRLAAWPTQSFDFTPRAILVPFASPYAPIWVGHRPADLLRPRSSRPASTSAARSASGPGACSTT